jgi:hypothetical protein
MNYLIEHLFTFNNWGIPTRYKQFTRLQDLAAKVWAGSLCPPLVISNNFLTEPSGPQP